MSADGTWKTTINSPMGVQEGTLTIATSGATFTGSMQTAQGAQDVSGKVDGNTLTWGSKLTQPFPIDLEFPVTVLYPIRNTCQLSVKLTVWSAYTHPARLPTPDSRNSCVAATSALAATNHVPDPAGNPAFQPNLLG